MEPPKYEQKSQYAEEEDKFPQLSKEENVFIQRIKGTCLYYDRTVDSTMLSLLSAIASQQSAPTGETMKQVKYLLDYCASQEDAIIP